MSSSSSAADALKYSSGSGDSFRTQLAGGGGNLVALELDTSLEGPEPKALDRHLAGQADTDGLELFPHIPTFIGGGSDNGNAPPPPPPPPKQQLQKMRAARQKRQRARKKGSGKRAAPPKVTVDAGMLAAR